MTADPLDDPFEKLAAKLADGDPATIERLYREYEPLIAMVIRRMMTKKQKQKFDLEDVAQSTWAHLLAGFENGEQHFADADHFRAYILKVAKSRLFKRDRHLRLTLEFEVPMPGSAAPDAPPATDPAPAEAAQANELWERLLAGCPPEHREILLLKSQGYSTTEVADRTGYHPSSVRRILFDAAGRGAFSAEEE